MIYLDNSATSFPKPKEVQKALNEVFTKYGANPGRSGHSFSLTSALKVNEIREDLANFFNVSRPEKVIFTSGCTEALNLAILGSVQEGGHVICSVNDHNSVLRPLFELKAKGVIDITVVEPENSARLTSKDIEKHIRPNTYMVCVNHISNVDGMEAELEAIGELCAQHCIYFLVDGAQSAGHAKLDMQKQHIDFLAIAPHKGLYALQGVGVLCYSPKVKLLPIKFGGTGTDSINVRQPLEAPEAFESGTIATPAIISLGAGLKFVKEHFEEIVSKLDDLTTYLNYELRNIEGVKVYTHPDNANGVLSFNIKDLPSTEVTSLLDSKYKICARSGLHCAPLKHKFNGTTYQGSVRLSLSYFSTFTEISKTLKAIKEIAKS